MWPSTYLSSEGDITVMYNGILQDAKSGVDVEGVPEQVKEFLLI